MFEWCLQAGCKVSL